MRKLTCLALALATLPIKSASADTVDGTWMARSGNWELVLVVARGTGHLSLLYGGASYTDKMPSVDVPVASDGTIDAYVFAPWLHLRHLQGTLPTLEIVTTTSLDKVTARFTRQP